jgi:hypothetical protein
MFDGALSRLDEKFRRKSLVAVGWIQHHQLYSSVGADIVIESTSRFERS